MKSLDIIVTKCYNNYVTICYVGDNVANIKTKIQQDTEYNKYGLWLVVHKEKALA